MINKLGPPEGYIQPPVSLRHLLEEYSTIGIISSEGGVLAYMWDPREDSVVWIREIFIHPDMRRRGEATKLIGRIAALDGAKRLMACTTVHEKEMNILFPNIGMLMETMGGFMIWDGDCATILEKIG